MSDDVRASCVEVTTRLMTKETKQLNDKNYSMKEDEWAMSNNYGVFSLEEKIVVVTGGAVRYGYYFCGALGKAGATVIVTSRDQGRAEDTAREFTDRGLKAFGYSLDIGDDSSIEAFVDAVIQDHGRIDVLVNNARTIPQMAASEVTREELDRAFTVNLTGMILLTRRVVEEMKQAGAGNIINIGSIYGMGGQDPSMYQDPEASVSLDYSVFKGGVIAYTKQLATTLAQYNIRANCLSLGGLRETTSDDYFLPRYNQRVPLGRMASGEDVAGPIVLLASEASAYMTGSNIVVDGGFTAW